MNPATLPSAVLTKIVQLEHGCMSLTTRLEQARRELQTLRTERLNCVPQTVFDEAGVNEETERVLNEWRRLDDAAEAQQTRIEALERRLRAEEAVVKNCKAFLHELPAGARLRVVESTGGDLDDIQRRISATKDEIGRVQTTPVLSDDLGERIAHYVSALAVKAAPRISDGPLRVLWPINDHANRVTLSGFAEHEANPLLLCALLHPELLAKRLLQCATESGIPAGERSQRLTSLQAQLTQLRYDEEAAISTGVGAVRSSSQPPWATLMLAVEHPQAVAA